MTILITGASGTLGSTVARDIAATGRRAVLATRRPHAVAAVSGGHATVRFLDYDDPATCTSALRGCTTVFLIAPLADHRSDERILPFLDAALASGVSHVVLNSAYLAKTAEDFALRRLERAVEDCGRGWTHLRSQWYMTSLTSGLFASMVTAGELTLPTGDPGRIAYVAPQDVAATATAILTSPRDHTGRAYHLTGPEALDGRTVADLCSRALGHAVAFRSISDDDYRARCRQAGLPDGPISLLLTLFAAVRDGQAAAITPDVRAVTGRAPLTLRRFLTQNR
ncbi:NAD(P)H-binding protein [Streptomyces sp. P1-3]|uniref:NmrA family NAD(P)-binding protein n=1 Tax=Streptomyces sp. P1-3 TaxID=3421658 RepID=UPI003D36C52B